MALFPFCKTYAGAVRVTRIQLVLYCFILILIIYILHGRKASVSVRSPRPKHPYFHSVETTTESNRVDLLDVRAAAAASQAPLETPWGAPLVWGDTLNSAWRKAEFAQQGIRIGLLALVVGTYARFVRTFLTSAETFFLPGQMVTYYILTDNPHSVDPSIQLGADRQLKLVPIAELPGWERLAYRRMVLLADAIRDPISSEVEYIFCADIDQEFLATVGEEILGDLVATLHPELYGMPRTAFPYEVEEVSSACVEEDEGDYYYTSEFYGGLVTEMYSLARACSVLIQRDQANGVMARGLEESYLNRYLINHRPTCVLSPEYNWFNSGLAVDVPVMRLVSLGRQCEALDMQKREQHKC
ncbi:globoside alpha-1,3-N-acetylgalactosaminyltransferase 1-like [Aulostomus maculatus]